MECNRKYDSGAVLALLTHELYYPYTQMWCVSNYYRPTAAAELRGGSLSFHFIVYEFTSCAIMHVWMICLYCVSVSDFTEEHRPRSEWFLLLHSLRNLFPFSISLSLFLSVPAFDWNTRNTLLSHSICWWQYFVIVDFHNLATFIFPFDFSEQT